MNHPCVCACPLCRLVDEKEQDWFLALLKQAASRHFHVNLDTLFAHLASMADAEAGGGSGGGRGAPGRWLQHGWMGGQVVLCASMLMLDGCMDGRAGGLMWVWWVCVCLSHGGPLLLLRFDEGGGRAGPIDAGSDQTPSL